jgi:hypothetical protein
MCAKAEERRPILIRHDQIDAARGFFSPTLLLLIVAGASESQNQAGSLTRTNLIDWIAAKLRFGIFEAIKQHCMLDLLQALCQVILSIPVQISNVASGCQPSTYHPASSLGTQVVGVDNHDRDSVMRG